VELLSCTLVILNLNIAQWPYAFEISTVSPLIYLEDKWERQWCFLFLLQEGSLKNIPWASKIIFRRNKTK
jgi:hypothetical protein